jgi:hypothetical protein
MGVTRVTVAELVASAGEAGSSNANIAKGLACILPSHPLEFRFLESRCRCYILAPTFSHKA